MSRAEQAAVLAAKFNEHAERMATHFTPRSSAALGAPVGDMKIRNPQADAMAELAELLAWVVNQLEPVQ